MHWFRRREYGRELKSKWLERDDVSTPLVQFILGLDESDGCFEIQRRCNNEIYAEDPAINFNSVLSVIDAEKFSRDNLDNPYSFFTNEYCQICGQGGDLLICENCPKVFHLKCIGLTNWPIDDFVCNFCKGTTQFECAKCFKPIQDIEQFHEQRLKQNLIKPFKLQLIPVECSLCLSRIHSDCTDVPIRLLLKSAYYYDLLEKDYGELLYIFERYQLLDPRIQYQEIFDLRQRAIDTLKGDTVIYYMCRVCQESRKIDVVCDIMNMKEDKDCNPEEQIDYNQCYGLVKFRHTSYIHSIWVEFSTLEDLGRDKLRGLQTKFKLETYNDLMHHQQAMKIEDFGDRFHNIDIPFMLAFRIVDQFRKGKYYLVKWRNLDYTQCTWEPAYFIQKNCMDLKYEFHRILQTQDLVNDCTSIGATYRLDLMKSQEILQQQDNLQPFTPYQSTPSFLNRANDTLQLHEYQVEGMNWLIDSWFKKTNVILADEMGLGKTVQAIAFISYLMNVQQITRPFLICVPLSTIENWVREFQSWCPEARVLPYISGKEENQSTFNQKSRPLLRQLEFFYEFDPNNKNFSKLRIPKFNVLLVPYQLLTTDFKHLVSIPWRCVIIDEGQRLKSCDTLIFRQALTLVTEHRILLSGTPLQNNISELFNLLEYLDPVKFCSETRDNFQKIFAESVMLKTNAKIFTKDDQNKQAVQSTQSQTPNPLTQESQLDQPQTLTDTNPPLRESGVEQTVNLETEKSALVKLQELLQPHILRRFKRDVFKNFPKKKEVILRVEMTQKQKQLAKCLIEKNFEALSRFENQKNTGIKVSLRQADNVLMILRMISNHPLHLSDLYGTEIFRLRYNGKNSKETFAQHEQMLNTVEDYIRDSGKLQYLDKMIDLMIPDGHRILLFTQFRGTLDILCDYLGAKGLKYLRLDGETQNLKRQKFIDLFNAPESEYRIFLLSTKAGGLGINLTSADTIFIFDSDFNPHNDIQALNRAHRIGQKNNVMIYRLVCKNSVEERIIEAAKHKLMLDTMMTHSAKNNKEESNSLYQILKFGTKKLFESGNDADKIDVNTQYTIDEALLSDLLNREKQFRELEEEELKNKQKDEGVRDYLSAFKVASIEKKVTKQVNHEDGMDINAESDAESISDDDNDNKVFNKLLNELKEKEKTIQIEKEPPQIVDTFPAGITTRNKLKEGNKSNQNQVKNRKNNKKATTVEAIDVEKEVTEVIKPAEQIPIEVQKCYQMSPEYAEFIGGMSSGKYQLHHDGQLYLAQMLGQMSNVINPMASTSPLHNQQLSEQRIQMLQKLILSKKHNIESLQILQLNESQQITTMHPYIKLWGFDFLQIKDFIDGFMKFGVQNLQFEKLFKKISKNYLE